MSSLMKKVIYIENRLTYLCYLYFMSIWKWAVLRATSFSKWKNSQEVESLNEKEQICSRAILLLNLSFVFASLGGTCSNADSMIEPGEYYAK